jgi:hypothetical protein
MIDFLTLTFDDNIEICLLKLQAISFKYIDEPMMDKIGKIFVFYNDSGLDKIEFIKQYYPEALRSKVSIIYRDAIMNQSSATAIKSSWRNQQYFKLYISKYIESECYIVLDGKNHFIRVVNLNDFMCNGKPKLYLENPGNMITYYKNCLSYFKIDDPFNYMFKTNKNSHDILLTTTPFVFITKQVLNLINYIQDNENIAFYDFFMNNKSITEFYLYSTYLIFSNNIDKHDMVKRDNFVVTIFNNPNDDINTFDKKKKAITNAKVKVFGLHRVAIKNMDDVYKQNLLNLYTHFFDDNTCCMIKTIMEI